MIQKIGKMLSTFIIFFSFFSKLHADPCTDWTLLLPPAREAAAMAFDSVNNQTILFGGYSNGQLITDTWSWDGTKWTQLFPSISPSGRQFAAMAFDPSTNQIILFGGSDFFGNLGDTWSWDGTNWTQLSPGTSPSARTGASMAFDSINNLLILFGGFSGGTPLNDTWNWNGSNWVQLLDGSTDSPPARGFATMAFGPTLNQMILFGGFGTVTRINDTWRWNGATTTWMELNDGSSGSPPARSNAVMGYDPVNNQNILFGGQNFFGDTWSWDGATWSVPSSITTSPSARDSASFALDANNNLILFGGIEGQIFGDTWSWTGTDWAVLNNPPSSRSNASMAFDTSTDQLILFGGTNFSTLFNDTFNWDGNAWIELSPATSPSQRAFASMAFDSLTDQLILFGGTDFGTSFNDTFNWDGTDWILLLDGTTDSPPPRSAASMAFDPATNQLILFGGFDSFGNVLSDTWNWDGTTWTQLFPSTSPPALAEASMAFDSATNQLILFGGYDGTSELSGTWNWNGTTWTQLFPSTSPPARSEASMAFDPGTNQLILFGGESSQFGGLTDTWSWDGNTWAQISTSTSPVFSEGTSMAFDSLTDQMILLDGTSNTWNFDSFPAFFAIATPSSESICSGGMTSIVISANVSGATFSWTADASGVSGASDGTGPLIAQTLSLTSSCTGTVIYTITPTNPSGCQGSPITVVVTVNPLPFAAATPPIQTISSGETATIALSSNIPGTTFSWTVVASGVSGASSGSGSLIAQKLSTNTCSSGTITYTITPSSPTGCPGSPLIAVVTVEPLSSIILPPAHAKGFQKNSCLKLCKINIIKWQSPKNGEPPASYRIYRNAKLTELVAKIPANKKLKFEDNTRHSHKTHTYYIVSLDSCGNRSKAVRVSVKRNCNECKISNGPIHKISNATIHRNKTRHHHSAKVKFKLRQTPF